MYSKQQFCDVDLSKLNQAFENKLHDLLCLESILRNFLLAKACTSKIYSKYTVSQGSQLNCLKTTIDLAEPDTIIGTKITVSTLWGLGKN